MREINELRDGLIRSERLAATGQAVAALSHSLKNILEGLRGGAYVYKRGIRLQDPSVRKEAWEMVERNIDRISSLVADLLNFSHARELELRVVNPNELVSDVVATLRSKADANGKELSCGLDPAAVSWPLDDHSMHQCLTNLVSNALDAIEEVEGGWVRVSTAVCEGPELRVRVADNGPGVPLALVDKLFSNMLSTKGSKGTGLGLLVAHKIAKEHGGTVELDRSVDVGAVFDVRLPWRELDVRALPGSGAPE
jgi:signal transduction histidine kinase